MRFPLLNSAVLSLTVMTLFLMFIPVKARPKSFSQSSDYEFVVTVFVSLNVDAVHGVSLNS